MTTKAAALGKDFDVIPAILPVDLNGGAATGFRLHLKNYTGVTLCVFASIGTAASDLDTDVIQYTAATGGTTADLDVVTDYYVKDALALTSDCQWAKVTQAAASEIAEVGGAGESGEHSQLLCINIPASALSDGYEWIAVYTGAPGAAKLGAAWYITWGLAQQRDPTNLPSPLT